MLQDKLVYLTYPPPPLTIYNVCAGVCTHIMCMCACIHGCVSMCTHVCLCLGLWVLQLCLIINYAILIRNNLQYVLVCVCIYVCVCVLADLKAH